MYKKCIRQKGKVDYLNFARNHNSGPLVTDIKNGNLQLYRREKRKKKTANESKQHLRKK